MPRWTASRTRLRKLCGWWATAAAAADPQGEPNRYALMGTALHALVDPEGDSAAALAALTEAEVDTVSEWHAAWLRSPWAAAPWRHEMKFAYHPKTDTARVLERTGPRDYSAAADDEIPGTADLVYVEDGTIILPDIKTGFGPGAEHVSQHSQLRFLALAASRALMVDRVRIQILRIDAVQLVATEHTLDAADLDAIAAEIRALWEQPDPQPQPGAHCADLYCPSLASCPRSQALARRGLGELVRADWSLTVPTTPEHALYLRDGADVLEELAKSMRAAARTYADEHGGVVLPDGRVWRRVDQERETIALNGPGGAEAMDTIARLAPGAVETKHTTSKEAIRKALVARAPELKGKTLNEALEQVLVPLRVCGATRTTTIQKYEETKR